jgi:type VI secretion system protein ImpC
MSDELKKEQASAEEQVEEPPSLLDEIVAKTKVKPGDDSYSLTRRGIKEFISQIVEPGRKVDRVSNVLIDDMIAEIDNKLSLQLDAILHHKDFQKLESAWKSLEYLVRHTDFRQNIRMTLLNVNKDELLEDFDNEMDITKTGLYQKVYAGEYGQHGGKPFGNMVANYEFGPGAQDIKLLQNVASVGAMAHCPFIASASPKFFGIDDFRELNKVKDLESHFEGPDYVKWQSLRESDDARNVALAMPRFLLRLPYDSKENPVKAFNYNENVSGSHEDYLWGNAAFAFATNLTKSFADYRWCTQIIGPQGGGTVYDLPLHKFDSLGGTKTKIPTEVLIPDRREYELAEQGFMALTMRKEKDDACFFSANSIQKPKDFPDTEEGNAAKTTYTLGTQLPYMFVANRLAHYMKVIQRENIGTWKSAPELNEELNKWIGQYISDMDNPTPETRSRRPLRKAQITVEEAPGEPGWYKVSLKVVPHFKYMGAYFTLSLVGKLDKK